MNDDAELLAQVARGDDATLRELYARFQPRIWRYLWGQLDGQAGRADDLTQEVFLVVWRSASRFRGAASVATWLFSIARFLALNDRRSVQRHGGDRLVPLEEVDDDPLDTPDDAIAARLDLDAALAMLSPKHRETLELVFGHGFTMDEAAQIMGIPTGTGQKPDQRRPPGAGKGAGPGGEPRL